jgi:hypothetical protein
MTYREQLLNELQKGALCDQCLSEIVDTGPGVIDRLIDDLEAKHPIRRMYAVCPRCRRMGRILYRIGALLSVDTGTQPAAFYPSVRVDDQPWYTRANTKEMLVAQLFEQGYRVLTGTAEGCHYEGVDVAAVAPSGVSLLIAVKGYPEGKQANLEATAGFLEALATITRYRQAHPAADLAIALPDGFRDYLNLLPLGECFVHIIPHRIFFIREDGTIRVELA